MAILDYDLTDNEKVAIDFYLACNTKIAAIRILRKLDGELRVLSDAGAKTASTKFFQRQAVVDYITGKEKEIKAAYMDRAVTVDIAKDDEERVNLATASKDKVNEVLIQTLEKVIKDPNSTSSDVISASIKIADIRNSKEKEDSAENGIYSKFVHYVVPCEICEKCERVGEIYEKNGHPATKQQIDDAFYKQKKQQSKT